MRHLKYFLNNANIQNVLKDISKNQFCEGKYVKNAGVPPMKFCLNWFAPESNKKDWYRKVMMLCSFVIRNPCWRRSKDLWASAENLAGLGCGSSCRLEKTWKPQELPSRMQTQTAASRTWSFYGQRWSKVLINSSIEES